MHTYLLKLEHTGRECQVVIRIGDAHSELSSECKLFTNVWRNR